MDAGAVSALRDRGVSLLAAGIIQVQGDFLRGDVVRCISEQGALVAQGLSNYSSSEIEKIKGLNSEVFCSSDRARSRARGAAQRQLGIT